MGSKWLWETLLRVEKPQIPVWFLSKLNGTKGPLYLVTLYYLWTHQTSCPTFALYTLWLILLQLNLICNDNKCYGASLSGSTLVASCVQICNHCHRIFLLVCWLLPQTLKIVTKGIYDIYWIIDCSDIRLKCIYFYQYLPLREPYNWRLVTEQQDASMIPSSLSVPRMFCIKNCVLKCNYL